MTFLPENLKNCPNARMLKSGCKFTQIAKIFTVPSSNETAIILEIVIFKAYIINQSHSLK